MQHVRAMHRPPVIPQPKTEPNRHRWTDSSEMPKSVRNRLIAAASRMQSLKTDILPRPILFVGKLVLLSVSEGYLSAHSYFTIWSIRLSDVTVSGTPICWDDYTAWIYIFQWKSTVASTPMVSKLSCFFGGGEESRTPVRKYFLKDFSGRSHLIDIPSAARQMTGLLL